MLVVEVVRGLAVVGGLVEVVRGVAVLDGLLYVVCELFSDIIVFDITTHQRLDSIKVAGLQDPNDIAACIPTKNLYIADCRMDMPESTGCMWKVSPPGTVSQWQLAGGVSPYSLSVRKGRILVTPLHGRQLFIYNSQQQLKKKIPLPGRMEPRHAVETSQRTVIVCHWGRRNATKVFMIGEFDASGNSLKMFNASDDLNDFPHVCLDSSGRVLLVDSWNNRVVLLNKDLQLEQWRTFSWSGSSWTTWTTTLTGCATWRRWASCLSASQWRTSRSTRSASRRHDPTTPASTPSSDRARRKHHTAHLTITS